MTIDPTDIDRLTPPELVPPEEPPETNAGCIELLLDVAVEGDRTDEHLAISSSLSRAFVHEKRRDPLRGVETTEGVRDPLTEAVSG